MSGTMKTNKIISALSVYFAIKGFDTHAFPTLKYKIFKSWLHRIKFILKLLKVEVTKLKIKLGHFLLFNVKCF